LFQDRKFFIKYAKLVLIEKPVTVGIKVRTGGSMKEAKLKVLLLRYTPKPEETVAMAAKLCYSPSDIESLKDKISQKDQRGFVKKLMSMGHLSPIEHASFTFAMRASQGPVLTSWSDTVLPPIVSSLRGMLVRRQDLTM